MTIRDEFDYAFFISSRILNIKRDIEQPPSGTAISRERRDAEVKAGLQWLITGKGKPTTGDKAILKYYPLPDEPTNYTNAIKERIQDIKHHLKQLTKETELLQKELEAEVKAGSNWLTTGKGRPTTGNDEVLKFFPLPCKPTNFTEIHIARGTERKKGLARVLAKLLLHSHPGSTARSAWNLLPDVLGANTVIKHDPIPDKGNAKARKTAKTTVLLPNEDEVTFKSFERAWETEKSHNQDKRQADKAATRKAEEERAEERLREKEKAARWFDIQPK